jgi:hypothetical protein
MDIYDMPPSASWREGIAPAAIVGGILYVLILAAILITAIVIL